MASTGSRAPASGASSSTPSSRWGAPVGRGALGQGARARPQGVGGDGVPDDEAAGRCGLAHARNFGDGQTRYEAAVGRHHHDHLICTRCGTIVEFENDRIEALQDAGAPARLRVTSHKMELYGLCQKCQSGQRARLIPAPRREGPAERAAAALGLGLACAHPKPPPQNMRPSLPAAAAARRCAGALSRMPEALEREGGAWCSFFATWCFPCLSQLPRLKELQERQCGGCTRSRWGWIPAGVGGAAALRGSARAEVSGADCR